MDKAKEFLIDFRNNWDNSYWWADHQWLLYILLITGIFGYSFLMEILRLRLRAKLLTTGDVVNG